MPQLLTPKQFVRAIKAASRAGTLVLEDGANRHLLSPGQRWPRRKVKIGWNSYGGFRWDRVHERNRITAMFGFETKSGGQWSASEASGSGTWLGNILAEYGTSYWFRVDGGGGRIHLANHDFNYSGDYISIGKKTKMTESDYIQKVARGG